jgi:hypothetical protein
VPGRESRWWCHLALGQLTQEILGKISEALFEHVEETVIVIGASDKADDLV